jgi:hypothetical protein
LGKFDLNEKQDIQETKEAVEPDNAGRRLGQFTGRSLLSVF